MTMKYSYKTEIDKDFVNNDNDSHSLILKQILPGSTVLECGPADGMMTRYMKKYLACKVYIIENDREAYNKAIEFAEYGICADLEKDEWMSEFKDGMFDHILYADVLEHLKKPQDVLKKMKRFLKNDGSVLISVPNVANGDIIANMLQGRFRYTPLGLLDDTHLHLFAREDVHQMIEGSGYYLSNETCTVSRPFNTEQAAFLNSEEAGGLVNVIYNIPETRVYQYICKILLNPSEKQSDVIKRCTADHTYCGRVFLNKGNGYSDNDYIVPESYLEEGRIQLKADIPSGCVQLRYEAPDHPVIYRNVEAKFNGMAIEQHDFEEETIIAQTKNLIFDIKEDAGLLEISAGIVYPVSKRTEEAQGFVNDIDLLIKSNKDLSDGMDKYACELECAKKANDRLSKNLYRETDRNRVLSAENKATLEKLQLLNNEFREAEEDNLRLKEDSSRLQEEVRRLDEKCSGLEDAIYKLRASVNKKDARCNELLRQIEECDAQLKSATEQRDMIGYRLNNLQNSFQEVMNSHCWKLTKPLRWVGDLLKCIIRRSALLTLIWKGEKSLRQNGFRYTWIRVKDRLFPRKSQRTNNPERANGNAVKIDGIATIENLMDARIAVHVHLFYEDLLEEICGYLDNIPFAFDIFVSVREGINLKETKDRLAQIRNVRKVTVEYTINRGRDIAPLYAQFGERIKKYDYFLHIHSKKSLFTGKEQKEWRQYSLDTLLGSEERVRKIFALFFDADRNVGLVFPETRNLHLIAHSWLSNKREGQMLLERLGIAYEDTFFNYPVGSFFWAKNAAVHDLFDLKLHKEDFPIEAGQTDGTLAHTLERAIAFVAKKNDHQLAIMDDEDGVVRFDVSLKIFKDYFSLQYEAVQYHLSRFEMVSLDIFDTLISRSVFCPDDIFRLMGERIKRELGIQCDFLAIRKKAEQKADERKGKKTNIYDIYEALPEVSSELGKYADLIREWEIDTELELCFPREEMLKVFNHIRSCGKRIILISDMYLPKAVIEKMLLKCGYEGYEDIWVSCEKGERKDDGTIWNTFFEIYGNLASIQCGDNPHSDIQLPGNHGKEAFIIINPRDELWLSDLGAFTFFKKQTDQSMSISMSVALGLIVNKQVFNSPFALGQHGVLTIDDPFMYGYSTFGPLLAFFTEWLIENCKGKELLFVAREGWVFKRFFDTYSEIMGDQGAGGVYFLASRRAVSLAAVKMPEDIKEILQINYEGLLSNLTHERLGFEIAGKTEDRNIVLPRDIDNVMNILSPFMQEIIDTASSERNAYKMYLTEVTADPGNAVLVDVGYSGTIQYFLSKMLERKVDGFYLSTWVDKKPERLGCNCTAAFPVLDPSEEFINPIFKNQLFLEAFLKAPFGQLIRFEYLDGKVQPVYKTDNEVLEDIFLMQKGALSFAEDYWRIINKYAPEERINGRFASESFDLMLNGKVMGKRVAACLNVSDDYCSNGKWYYSLEEKKFIIVNGNGNI